MAQCQFLFISVHCRKGPKMKVLRKIWKNYRNSKRPEDPGSQKERRRRATRWPHLAQARSRPGRAWGGEPTSDTASRRLFAYKMPPDLKLTEESASIHETFRSSAAVTDKIRGTESLCFGTLPGRGIAPKPSPSTPPPSSSPLLTLMMMRE